MTKKEFVLQLMLARQSNDKHHDYRAEFEYAWQVADFLEGQSMFEPIEK